MKHEYDLGFGGETIELNNRQWLAESVLSPHQEEEIDGIMGSEDSLLQFAEGSEIDVDGDDIERVFAVIKNWLEIKDGVSESHVYHTEVLFNL